MTEISLFVDNVDNIKNVGIVNKIDNTIIQTM